MLLGNGDGTFRPAVAYDSGGPETNTVAVADVNGDGRPDLAVANFRNNTVGVLLGNPDGTFRPVVTYPSSAAGSGATCPDAVAIADLNGDGKPDIVVTNYCGESYLTKQIGILLGNGDGTFRPAVDYGSGGESPYSVVVADVNGDGKPDLLVANWLASFQDAGQGSVGVLMGNGDGTFQPAIAYDSGGTLAYSLAVSDVNGDGKPDVAVANCAPTNSYACPNWGGSGGRGVVGILLGNGDGTFQPVVTYDSGGLYATSVAIADVNADGRPDVLVTDWCASNNCGITGRGAVGVLLGNGDGTVQPAVTFDPGGQAAWSVALADVNADGRPDLLVANNFSSSVGVLLNNTKSTTLTSITSSLNPCIYGERVTWTAMVTSSGSITPTGTVRFKAQFFTETFTIGSATLNSSGVATLTKSNLNASTYPLTAVYVGDASNLGSTSAVLKQVVLQTTSTAKLTSSPNPSTQGQAVTFTATISSPTVIPTGPVTFTSGKTVLGTAQLSGGKAKLVISSLSVGSTKVTVTYYGNSNIAKSSASVVQTVH